MKTDPKWGEVKANQIYKASSDGATVKAYKRRYRGEWYSLPIRWRDEFPFDVIGFGGRTESMSRKEWRRRVFNNLRHAWQRVKREAAKAA